MGVSNHELPEFPYRTLLEELTVEVRDKGLDPYDAYQTFYNKQQRLGLVATRYLSTAIVSGGHVRDVQLTKSEAAERNITTTLSLAEELVHQGQLTAASTVEPVAFGRVPWSQAEYMEFSYCVIAGFTLKRGFKGRDVRKLRKAAYQAFEAYELDRDLLNTRAGALKMPMAMATLITEGSFDCRSVEAVVRMVDTKKSLGAKNEQTFARQIGVTVLGVAVVKHTSAGEFQPADERLAHSLENLTQLGAEVFQAPTSEQHLVLLKDSGVA